jgi:hypothetical protein
LAPTSGAPPFRRISLTQEDRALARAITMIENGFVQIPETTPWLAEYLHLLTVFAKGEHDDPVGSTALFLDWFKKPFPEKNIFEYYRRLAQAAEARHRPKSTET